MIPILYEPNETAFVSNGIGRLRSCLSAVVSEERNGIYELDFEYPVDGANFDLIQPGRIVAVTHDDSGDVQPFDIVGYSKPINGVVTFHAVHISYRQSGYTVAGTNINSLSAAFSLLGGVSGNPFTYNADFSSSAYMAAADGVPRTVRQLLGGVEGSILDTYGGEYEFDRFNVNLYRARGQYRDFTIRYGVNLLDYTEDTDYSGTYSAVIPYWTGQNAKGVDTVRVAAEVDSGLVTYTGRKITVPLDLTEKFETIPTTTQLRNLAASILNSNQPNMPQQSITVDFVRLQDMPEYSGLENLLQCRLCDSINVVFPKYNMTGTFKIVKVVYDVLLERYQSMELGTLSTTLADALGITQGGTFQQGIDGIAPGENFELTLGTDASITSGQGYGTYDPNTGLVTITGTFYASGNNFPMSTAAFTVPSDYRPAASVRIPAYILRSTLANCRPYYMTLGTGGNIIQTFSSTVGGAIFTGVYKL